jgi:hypothetical protein
MLPSLVTAGLLTPDDDLERNIRARLGAGELPEEAERAASLRIATSNIGGVSALAEQIIARKRHGKSN